MLKLYDIDDLSFAVPPCELTKNGGCEQTCTNNGDKAECSCKAIDFKLGGDGKSCKPGMNKNLKWGFPRHTKTYSTSGRSTVTENIQKTRSGRFSECLE